MCVKNERGIFKLLSNFFHSKVNVVDI